MMRREIETRHPSDLTKGHGGERPGCIPVHLRRMVCGGRVFDEDGAGYAGASYENAT